MEKWGKTAKKNHFQMVAIRLFIVYWRERKYFLVEWWKGTEIRSEKNHKKHRSTPHSTNTKEKKKEEEKEKLHGSTKRSKIIKSVYTYVSILKICFYAFTSINIYLYLSIFFIPFDFTCTIERKRVREGEGRGEICSSSAIS